jgi:ubiquinone/menaquinone biosynthesis C-methylase UbiE
LVGCQTAAPPPEASVRPGINVELLQPDLDVRQWVERFEREGREIFDRRQEIVRAARIRPGMSVADIGAGTGLFTPLLAEAVGPRGTVYAVDIVKSFLALIEERAAAGGLRNVRTVLCSDRSVGLPPDSVDLAFICDTYHHFEYPRNSMASLHRALRAGGEVVLIDFKRIPGESSDWVLNHVRAGQDVVEAEILAAGFRKTAEERFLKDNYLVRFRKVPR